MSLTEMKLECNSKIRIDFGGGNLSSDGGLLLMNEFLSKIGFERLVAAKFKTSDDAKRFHSDVDNLMWACTRSSLHTMKMIVRTNSPMNQ